MKDQEARGPERKGNRVLQVGSVVKVAWSNWGQLSLTSCFDQRSHQTWLSVKAKVKDFEKLGQDHIQC